MTLVTAPGDLIASRYRIGYRLASGGMGAVWFAWDETLLRSVALKELLPQPGISPLEASEARDRVFREARITARLHHPHVVTLYDVVEHEGRPCLIMQFVPSRSLADLLREHGALSSQTVAGIGADLASALAAAHRVGIIHRDVKPGNVLIDADGSAKLTDFGISHAVGDAFVTSTGMLTGTPAYIAPEVARGERSNFAADVYALGATLYAALEGAPPFGTDDNPMALLHRVASGQPIPPQRSGALTPLLVRMVSSEPDRRPTLADAERELEKLRDGLGAVGRSTPLLVVKSAPSTTSLVAENLANLSDATELKAEPQSRPVAAPLRRHETPAATAVAPLVLSAPGGPAPTPAPAAVPAAVPTAAPRGGASQRLGDRTPVRSRFLASAAVLTVLLVAGVLMATVLLNRQTTGGTAGGASVASSVPATGGSGDTSAASSSRAARLATTGSAASALSSQHPQVSASNPGVAPLLGSDQPTSSSRTATQGTSVPTGTTSASASETTLAAPTSVTTKATAPAPAATATTTTATAPTGAGKSASVTTSASSSSGASSPTPSSTTKPTAAELAASIADYYALLPQGTDDGWNRLAPDFQNGTAHDRQYYQNFWDGVASVSASDVTGTPPDSAQATITYHFKTGEVAVERTTYTLVRHQGVLKIESSDVLSSDQR